MNQMFKKCKLFSKKASSDFIVVLIIIAVFGAVGMAVFNKVGSTYKKSNDAVTNQVGTQLNTAGSSIQYNTN